MQMKFDKILGLLRESDVPSVSGYPSVVNFASLPSASGVSGQTYLVQNITGIWPINFKQKGLYMSDGASWNYLGIQYDTTSLKVGSTTVTNSPVELTASGLIVLTSDSGNGKVNIGATFTETDPVFIASAAHSITSGHITILGNTSNTNTGDETNSSIKTKLGTDLSNKYDSGNFVAGTNYQTPLSSTQLSANVFQILNSLQGV